MNPKQFLNKWINDTSNEIKEGDNYEYTEYEVLAMLEEYKKEIKINKEL